MGLISFSVVVDFIDAVLEILALIKLGFGGIGGLDFSLVGIEVGSAGKMGLSSVEQVESSVSLRRGGGIGGIFSDDVAT